MKKILFFILSCFICTVGLSQIDINPFFTESSELIIKFHIADRSELEILTRIVSIDNIIEDEVTAYVNPNEFAQFLTLNIPYEIVEKPVLTLEELNMMDFEAIKNSRNNWNYYPTYQAYLDLMNEFATTYPDICRLVEIGTSVQNRKLWACVLSKNVNVREAEPQVFFTSTMHGDEVTGYVLMLRYIDYLLSNYGTDVRVTYLLDNLEIWVNPLANPDGTFHGSTINQAIRYNANGVDLNRNYKDWVHGDHPDGKSWQKETLAFMALQEQEHFTLAVNIHGGSEVCNYPWDNTYTIPADNAWWNFVCREYADTAQFYSPSNYMTFKGGVVRGCNWYIIDGGRQDYANYYNHTREFTLEISNFKTPSANQLPNFWNYNYRSFLNYTQQALYGVHGVVTDACTGTPIHAKIFINSHDVNESFVMTDPRVGYYARPLKGAVYTITYSADGYISQTETITISDRQTIIKNIQLVQKNEYTAVANFVADKTEILSNETVQFTDKSENATTWQWVFEGGTPTLSNEQNPVILYTHKGIFTVKLTASNELGDDEMIKENYISVDELGINETNAFSVRIFPNPISRENPITIEADINIMKIELFTLFGAVVKTSTPNIIPYSFSISDVETGIYILKIETEKGIYITKVQIQ
jgi:PKD repeat protein